MTRAPDIEFDDPPDLGIPSRVAENQTTVLAILDYARRSFERKGDRSSMERAKEIRRLFEQIARDSVMLHQAIVPEEVTAEYLRVLEDSHRAGLYRHRK